MASTDKPVSATKSGLESGTPVKSGGCKYSCADVVLRVSVFATTLVSIIVIVTSNQTEMVPYPVNPLIRVPVKAKFSHSPAFIYFLAAMSVTCLYSIITTLASLSVIKKPACKAKSMLHFALLDVMALGLVASATGAAAGVAYIGLKGNSHVNWSKICNVYDTFCRHLGASIALSLVTSILLVLLISLSICSLHSKINRC